MQGSVIPAHWSAYICLTLFIPPSPPFSHVCSSMICPDLFLSLPLVLPLNTSEQGLHNLTSSSWYAPNTHDYHFDPLFLVTKFSLTLCKAGPEQILQWPIRQQPKCSGLRYCLQYHLLVTACVSVCLIFHLPCYLLFLLQKYTNSL